MQYKESTLKAFLEYVADELESIPAHLRSRERPEKLAQWCREMATEDSAK